jgi:hypothetical protein
MFYIGERHPKKKSRPLTSRVEGIEDFLAELVSSLIRGDSWPHGIDLKSYYLALCNAIINMLSLCPSNPIIEI